VAESQHERFHLKNLDQLRAEIERLGLEMSIDEDVSVLSTPLTIAEKTMPNRFSVQPMEGFDAHPNGSPGELSFRRYRRYASGGFGLIWFEATAVMEEARSNPGQLWLHTGSVGAFRELVESTRRAAQERFDRDVILIVQLTHSGRYSKSTGRPRPLIAHRSPILDPRHDLPEDYPVVSDDYLDRLQDTYVEVAKLAAQAGFDGVDIKSCHRYLVSELLASFTREGKYGGSFENRTRLLRESLARIKDEVPGVFITTRVNAYDAISYPYGFGVDKDDYRVPDLTEPIELVRILREMEIPVLNVSIGNPYFNPHFGRPYDFPIKGFSVPDEHPLTGLDRFMSITRQIQESFPNLPVIGSGYTWLRQFMPYVAAGTINSSGATVLGIGRGAFAYPDTPRDVIETGRMDPAKCCVTCSACTQIMRDGGKTGCVVRDSEIYGPQYRLGRRFSLDRLQEEARRCRDCEQATCTTGCPAHVDVPAFIKAFAEGDIETSYDVLRASNVLPEMCATICPSEVQCEGGCLENIFCLNPVAIRDIQLVVSRIARREGLTGVRLPKRASGKRVAIVGGGPAGVAGAIKLLELGHQVTIFERGQKLGGTPDCIIPADRYGEAGSEVDAVLEPARKAGRIEVKFGQALGEEVALDDLRRDYDAVLIAVGLSKSSSLGDAEGVVDALAFLRQAKTGSLTAVPDKVAVLGGGNTAMDAAVTARNLGATDVYLVYRRSFGQMPAWPKERDEALESGVHFMLLMQPVGYETDRDGKLTGLRVQRTELGAPDDSGRRRPVPVEGSESVLNVGLVVEALGQGVSDALREALESEGVAFTQRGLIETARLSSKSVDGSSATSVAGVFAAGDLVNGGTTAVQGISEGMQAAEEIDRYL
jgi:NADPH-dependent glutamate synthase beta subunit-like oxidoreductase/2,4-dienoyl-CoA reductase-like NADH-dependent reductase (Old Yellow Enzyme family)